jgi:serine protease Do
VTPEIAESLGLDDATGALVADVMDATPAAEAGVEVGDVIVEFDGQPIRESNDLPAIVARTPVGKRTSLEIIRGTQRQTLAVTIGELADTELEVSAGTTEELGLTVQTLTPEIAESLGIDADISGVVIAGVEPGSAAGEAGLQRGDVILEANRKPIDNEKEFAEAVRGVAETKSVLLLVRRGSNTIFVALKKPRSDEDE